MLFVTADIGIAFLAALRLYQFKVWESPDGPAIVRDVEWLTKGEYAIRVRLIAEWGKEAYS